jgi:chromosome segregation ATPase
MRLNYEKLERTNIELQGKLGEMDRLRAKIDELNAVAEECERVKGRLEASSVTIQGLEGQLRQAKASWEASQRKNEDQRKTITTLESRVNELNREVERITTLMETKLRDALRLKDAYKNSFVEEI